MAADAELILRMTANMTGTALCALADACVGLVRLLVTNFCEEVDCYIEEGCCSLFYQLVFNDEVID